MRPMKRYVLNRPMKPGGRIPKVPGGTLAIEVISTEAGIPQFFEAFDRLAKSCPTRPSPLFGPMSYEEWIKLHLRHSELHLSFLIPDSYPGFVIQSNRRAETTAEMTAQP